MATMPYRADQPYRAALPEVASGSLTQSSNRLTTGSGSNVAPRRAHRARRASRWLQIGGLVAVAFAGGAVTGGAHTALAKPVAAQESPYAFLGQLARVLVLIENEYVEPVDRTRLWSSIKGMVAELDPHSSYLPAQDYSLFQSDTEGRFGGVGVEVDLRDEQVTVIAPIEGSPAERAGVQSGDKIVAIDGENVRGKPTDDLVKRMRGKPGSIITLTIKRRGVSKLLNFKLTREVIQVTSVASQLLDGNVAYLRIKAFQSGTHAELLEAIGKLRKEAGGPLKGTILDLRNNPGGLVDECSAVADEFLTSGVIYSTRHRGKVVDEVSAKPGGALKSGPMVVLVNEYSASAAELVAGALKDQQRAKIIGAPTFGKGSVQSILDLPGGAGLRLTTMRYYTPSGFAIQAKGIQPDVLVEAAYARDTSFGVIRESDLENHLPAEGPPGSAPKKKDEKPKTDGEEDLSETHLGVARKIPKNPTGGSDLALSIGYQVVKGVLKK
ncbi:MAG: S41 family peptidase [Polyangiaceae bacterium]